MDGQIVVLTTVFVVAWFYLHLFIIVIILNDEGHTIQKRNFAIAGLAT